MTSIGNPKTYQTKREEICPLAAIVLLTYQRPDVPSSMSSKRGRAKEKTETKNRHVLQLVVALDALIAVHDDLLGLLCRVLDLLLDLLLSLVLLGGSGCLHGLLVVLLVGLGLLLAGPGVDAVGTLLRDELGEVLDRARATVLDGLVLLAGAEQLDGGETSNLVGNIIGSSVNLGDLDLLLEVGLVLVEVSELVVLGGETANRLVQVRGQESGGTYALQCPHQGA